ncbi:MAG: Purine-binding protein precursor [Candidatus Heimdallarchaeota archaeon LC_3]|nr:MAG: Purine-binding protein precursor [Candidatus Heimdallarchaeota archaeon LC_3]
MKMKWCYAILISMLVMTVPGSSSAIVNNEGPSGESSLKIISPEQTFKAALMVGGDETDLGFSYLAIQGMNLLRDKYGWEISISRKVQFPDQSRIASELASENDVVFAVGGQFIETLIFPPVANNFNDTFFVQIPGIEVNEYFNPIPHNVVGLDPSFQTIGHYLAGVLAGQMTTTNRLGVIFGEWFPYLSMEFYAFKAGVESVNDDALVFTRVAGSWGDASLGKQITQALINQKNVDIIVQVADTTGRGVIAAVQENNISVIGTVGDQATLAPDVTMTSIGMDTPLLMEIVAQRIENGTAKSVLGGTSWDLPIGNFLYPYHEYDDIIPQAVKDSVDQAKADIESGLIVVPRTVTDDPPADPDPTNLTTKDTNTGIPGFQFLDIMALTTVIGIFIVMRRRRK